MVTLFEPHEFALLGVSEVAFRDGVAAHGYDWCHLPIRDMHAPDQRFESGWETAGRRSAACWTPGGPSFSIVARASGAPHDRRPLAD